MRIFLAGASGVIGVRLVPLLTGAGHSVVGLTRTASKTETLRELGAEPVVGDVYEADWLAETVAKAASDLVMHQLTDLPDDSARIPEHVAGNSRIRIEGTDNLLAAARQSGEPRFIAQSVAWSLEGEGAAGVEHLERVITEYDGTVLRYGQFYGPGTYHEGPPPPPRIHIDEAARRTVEHLEADSGILEIVEQ